jgi:hypothetical protein
MAMHAFIGLCRRNNTSSKYNKAPGKYLGMYNKPTKNTAKLNTAEALPQPGIAAHCAGQTWMVLILFV